MLSLENCSSPSFFDRRIQFAILCIGVICYSIMSSRVYSDWTPKSHIAYDVSVSCAIGIILFQKCCKPLLKLNLERLLLFLWILFFRTIRCVHWPSCCWSYSNRILLLYLCLFSPYYARSMGQVYKGIYSIINNSIYHILSHKRALVRE